MELKEYYHWQITLDDGHVIEQSADGEEETFKFDNNNPNFSKVKSIKLTPKDVSSYKLSEVTLEIPDSAKLIYFKRTISNSGNLFPRFQLTLIGWQMNLARDGKGKNLKNIIYVYPDGRILSTFKDNPEVEDFIAGLPKKDISEVKGCSGCKPELVKAKTK